jgi:hypothetical protein
MKRSNSVSPPRGVARVFSLAGFFSTVDAPQPRILPYHRRPRTGGRSASAQPRILHDLRCPPAGRLGDTFLQTVQGKPSLRLAQVEEFAEQNAIAVPVKLPALLLNGEGQD